MRKYLNLLYNKEKRLYLDVYLPQSENFNVIVYFHGGGLEVGERNGENIVQIAQDFVKEGYGFVSADYSLYPSAKFPSYILDCALAIKFVKENLKEWGAREIIVAGQSAGAWLSLMLCLNNEYLNSVSLSPQDICAWIIDSAQTTSHYNVLKYEQKEDVLAQRINEFAPLYYVNKNTSFSKMLLVFYQEDMPCRYEQNMLFYKSILAYNKNANITYKVLSGGHCEGSSKRDSTGNYPFVEVALNWLKTNL